MFYRLNAYNKNTTVSTLSKKVIALFLLAVLNVSGLAYANDKTPSKNTDQSENALLIAQEKQKEQLTSQTLSTLLNFVELQDQLKNELEGLQQSAVNALSDTELKDLKAQIASIEEKIKDTALNLENIAADTDLALLRATEKEEFNLQKELMALLEPALTEMKNATSDVRLKAELREKIDFFKQREPIAREALRNISQLNRANDNPKIKQELIKMNRNWSKQLVFIQSELQAKELQLEKIVSQENSLENQSESIFKNFFQRRGWTLIQAFLSIIAVLIISRIVQKLITMSVKGYRAEHRGVQLRVIDLLHRLITLLLAILAPMVIFYLEEDWVLFSLGVLLLIALAWTLRHAIPRYWTQFEIFLNVGPVREGERLELNGLPWRVKHINMYSILENPVAELTQRVDINDLVNLRSRPVAQDEPWFPCKKGDWVILKDGVRGKIIGLSMELVQIIQRGGTSITYQMSDFLSQSPKNLSKSFRIKETVGISYQHQKESTTSVLQVLETEIRKRAIEEGYEDSIQSIRVEFETAAASSLNLVVIADFKGDVADIYNRLRRSIQRWSVDICTENGWSIPFPQLQIHRDIND